MFVGALWAYHRHYVNAMKGVVSVAGPTGKALQGGDMDVVSENAGVMARNFALIAAWREGRGTTSAVNIADEAHEAAEALHPAAVNDNAAAAQEAFNNLRGSCKSRYSQHCAKNDDESWGFKD